MKRSRPPWTFAALVAVCCCVLMLVSGCSQEQIEEYKAGLAKAQQASIDLDPTIAQIESDIADAPIGDDIKPLQDALTEAVAKKAWYDAIADDYITAIADVDDPGVLVGKTVQSVAPAVPQPWGTWLGIIGTAIAGVSEARRRRTQKAAENVVISIEKTKSHDGILDFQIGADELRSRMTSDARELVSKARDKVKPREPQIGVIETVADYPLTPETPASAA